MKHQLKYIKKGGFVIHRNQLKQIQHFDGSGFRKKISDIERMTIQDSPINHIYEDDEENIEGGKIKHKKSITPLKFKF